MLSAYVRRSLPRRQRFRYYFDQNNFHSKKEYRWGCAGEEVLAPVEGSVDDHEQHQVHPQSESHNNCWSSCHCHDTIASRAQGFMTTRRTIATERQTPQNILVPAVRHFSDTGVSSILDGGGNLYASNESSYYVEQDHGGEEMTLRRNNYTTENMREVTRLILGEEEDDLNDNNPTTSSSSTGFGIMNADETNQQLQEHQHSSSPSFVYDTNLLMKVLTFWSNQHSIEGALMCEKILYKAIERDNSSISSSDKVLNTSCFEICMSAFSKVASRTSGSGGTFRGGEDGRLLPNVIPEKAEGIIQQMKEIALSGNKNFDNAVTLTTFVYTICIDCWAKSGLSYAGERAEVWLNEMERLGESTVPTIAPNAYSYACAINAWGNLKDDGNEGTKRAVETLRRFDERVFMRRLKLSADIITTYSTCLSVCAERGDIEQADLVKEMVDAHISIGGGGRLDVVPNPVYIATLMKAFANYTTRSSKDLTEEHPNFPPEVIVQKAEEAYQSMAKLYHNGLLEAKPNIIGFNAFLHVVGLHNPQKADALLDELIKDYLFFQTTGSNDDRTGSSAGAVLCPNNVTFVTVLNAYARHGNTTDGALKAEGVLNKMQHFNEQRSESNRSAEEPNIHAYNVVLDAWSRSDLVGAAERAQSILEWMEDGRGAVGVKPDALSYGRVAQGWMKKLKSASKNNKNENNDYTHAEKEEAIMMAGQCLYKVLTSCEKNDAAITTAAMDGSRRTSQERFQKFFPYFDVRILMALAQSDSLEATNLAMSIFEKLEKPGAAAYRHALASLSKIDDNTAAKKALEIIERMNRSDNGSTHAINMALSLFARQAKASKPYSLLAVKTLERMEHLSQSSGANVKSLLPTVDTYNLTLATLARYGGNYVGAKALEILQRLVSQQQKANLDYDEVKRRRRRKIPINEETFVLTLSACAAAERDTEKFTRAQKVFDLLEEYNNSNLSSSTGSSDSTEQQHPTTGTKQIAKTSEMYYLLLSCLRYYNDVMDTKKAWETATDIYEMACRENQVTVDIFNLFLEITSRERKQRVKYVKTHISEMEEAFRNGTIQFHPNASTYDIYLNALSHQKSIERAQEANDVLARMKHMDEEGQIPNVAPTLKTYSSLMSACRLRDSASNEDKLAAMAIAIGAYKEAIQSKYVEPNHITFQRFILAFKALTPENSDVRNRLLKMAFKDCCRYGQVDDIVLSLFRTHITKDLFSTLIRGGSDQTSVSDLPSEWSKNVHKK